MALKKLFNGLQDEMSAMLKLSKYMSHPVDKGDNSEYCWIDWMRRYLPKRYSVDKATIIDCKGKESDQIDAVIYDRQYSYLAFNQNGRLYLPAESVYAVFEIKQTLNKTFMEYASKKAESVRVLHRTSKKIIYSTGEKPAKKLHTILSGILTTDTGWKDKFGKAFKKGLKTFTGNAQLDCGCALNAGSFFYDSNQQSVIIGSDKESLVSFFLQLLSKLQAIGTVPAIDLEAYAKNLKIQTEKI